MGSLRSKLICLHPFFSLLFLSSASPLSSRHHVFPVFEGSASFSLESSLDRDGSLSLMNCSPHRAVHRDRPSCQKRFRFFFLNPVWGRGPTKYVLFLPFSLFLQRSFLFVSPA